MRCIYTGMANSNPSRPPSEAETALIRAQDTLTQAITAWQEVEKVERTLAFTQIGLERDMANRLLAKAETNIEVLQALHK